MAAASAPVAGAVAAPVAGAVAAPAAKTTTGVRLHWGSSTDADGTYTLLMLRYINQLPDNERPWRAKNKARAWEDVAKRLASMADFNPYHPKGRGCMLRFDAVMKGTID